MFGGPEGVIVLVLILVLFGGSQLPKLAKNLGEAQRELRKGMDGSSDAPAATPATPAPTDTTPAAPTGSATPPPAAPGLTDPPSTTS